MCPNFVGKMSSFHAFFHTYPITLKKAGNRLGNMGDFSDEEWELIFDELKVNSKSYGLPDIVPGSINIGSFNIRKLGTVSNRIDSTWKFLGITCKRFDLIAVQECMDNLDGIYRLMQELNKDDEYKLICSDKTGTVSIPTFAL